jgi:hypothetical protein
MNGDGKHGLPKVKSKFNKRKKRVAGEKVAELPSDEELVAQFNTVRNHKNPKIFKPWRKAK